MGVRDCIDTDSTVRHLLGHFAFFCHKAPLMLGGHPTKHFQSPSREISKEMYMTLRTTRMNLTDVAKSVRAEVWCASREKYSRHNLSAASNKSKARKAQGCQIMQTALCWIMHKDIEKSVRCGNMQETFDRVISCYVRGQQSDPTERGITAPIHAGIDKLNLSPQSSAP